MAAAPRDDDCWGAYENPRQKPSATSLRQVGSALARTLTQPQRWQSTTTGSRLLNVTTSPPPPKKAKHHRRRHVPVGPAGVWFQAQHQHLQQGTNNGSSNAAHADDDNAPADEECGIEFTQGLSSTSATKVAPSGVAFYSPAWIAMQCSLKFVTPSLPAFLSELERYVACRPHVPGHFAMIPEILAGHCDWKLEDNDKLHSQQIRQQQRRRRRLLVLVDAIQSLADNLWVAELTDETGAKISCWIQPRLVQQEQQRPKKKFVRPGMVWMLRNVTILLMTRSSQDVAEADYEDDEEHHHHGRGGLSLSLETRHERMLLVGEENIEQVWTPPQADDANASSSGISDTEYIAWMERRNALTTSTSIDQGTEFQEQEHGLLTAATETATANRYATSRSNNNGDTVDLETTDDPRFRYAEGIVNDDHVAGDEEDTGYMHSKGVGDNKDKDGSTNPLVEIVPISFHNVPPGHFGRRGTATLPSQMTPRTRDEAIACQEQRNTHGSKDPIATSPSRSSRRSFEEFSAGKHNDACVKRPLSTFASKGQHHVVDKSIHSPDPLEGSSVACPATQATAPKASSSQTRSLGLEKFAADAQSTSRLPTQLPATPKMRTTVSPRGNCQANDSAGTTTARTTTSERTTPNDSDAIPTGTDRNTLPVNRPGKENKIRSSSSRKKHNTKCSSKGGGRKPRSNLWVSSGADMLDLFDEEDVSLDDVTLPLAQNVEPATRTVVESNGVADSQELSASTTGETSGSTSPGSKANALQAAPSLFQSTAFESLAMGDFSEDEED